MSNISNNDFAIVVVWPFYPLSPSPESDPIEWPGHAGVILIEGDTGSTKYYEYGPYYKEGKGQVRTKDTPNVIIQDGTINGQSFDNLMRYINIEAGANTYPWFDISELDSNGYQKATNFANKSIIDPVGTLGEYNVFLDNHCYTFAKSVAEAGGSYIDWFDGLGMFDNTPSLSMLHLKFLEPLFGSSDVLTDLPTTSPLATPPRIDPLILDLDGDGIELVSVADSTAFFDMNVDGFAERTGWVNKDDGLLVIDTNGNDRIDDGSELFGDQAGFAHGFAQLAALDTNQDGVMDAEFLHAAYFS